MTTNRRGWMTGDAARSLAEERAQCAVQIAGMPALPAGHLYIRSGYEGYATRKVLRRVGTVAVYKQTGFAKPSWWVVCAVSGYAFGSFSQAGPAKALCAALGKRVEAYWARAALGDARAGTTIARLCRIHKSRTVR